MHLHALLLALACAATPDPTPVEEPMPALADLRFEEPRSAALHTALRQHALARTPGWRHLPLSVGGNFVRERWCSPSVPAPACEGGAVANGDEPGTAWFSLSTLHYPAQWPAVFGVGWDAGDLTPPWGAAAYLSLRGRTVTGSSFTFRFVRYEGGRAAERFEIPSTWAWQAGETQLFVPVAPPEADDEARAQAVEAELARLLASPASFRDTVLALADALEAEVLRALAAHEAKKCEYGEYQGDGIPPICTPVPFTPEEEAAERARLQAAMARLREVVTAEGEVLWARLGAVFPGSGW